MTLKYGDTIRLKDGVMPQMSLDADTFFSLVDDENAEIKTYWSLPEEAFEIDDMGFVYLKSEFAKKLVWGVDCVVRIDNDSSNSDNRNSDNDIHYRININVAFDPEGDVNCGAFCSWIDGDDVLDKE